MKRFLMAVAVLLGLSGIAMAGNTCYNGAVGQLQAQNYVAPGIQTQIVLPNAVQYQVVPQQVLQLQTIQRVYVPQNVQLLQQQYGVQPLVVQQRVVQRHSNRRGGLLGGVLNGRGLNRGGLLNRGSNVQRQVIRQQNVIGY